MSGVERRRFAAMGSFAEIIAVGRGTGAAVDAAIVRLNELERRWSRFIDASEVAALNRMPGAAVRVSDDTILLVELACDAWRRTGGRFDPTVLRTVESIGYTTSFDRMQADMADIADVPQPVAPGCGCDGIVVDRTHRTVQLPPGGGFDPGGIGKGLAADLVAYELSAAGVAGGCVNVGGDLRVWGDGPGGRCWRIGVGGRTLEVTDVGVATSSTRRRAWRFGGESVHHVIDPATARPAMGGPDVVTVVAGSAWRAETYATALLTTPPDAVDLHTARWGVRALVA